jgi:hypothetical protein
MNPYFISGFSAVSYMPYLTGMPDYSREWSPVASKKDEEKVHSYLHQQGMESLIPQ